MTDYPERISLCQPARAIWIWLTVLFAVLAILWLQTWRGPGLSNNLLISGDTATAGAKVYIDGQPAGEMVAVGASRGLGFSFYGHLRNGQHLIELRRPGCKPIVRHIDMHKEMYLGVQSSSH